MNQNLRRWIALLALPLGVLSCAKSGQEGSTDKGAPSAEAKAEAFGSLTVDEVEAKIAEAKAGKLSLHIFDNNAKGRWEKSHLPGAKWVKSSDVKATDLPADKEATLVFYCSDEQ
jgi:hypothetical protein